MADLGLSRADDVRFGAGLVAHVVANGAASHPVFAPPALTKLRDVADTVHHFGLFHARHPGIVTTAAERTASAAVVTLLRTAAPSFDRERRFMIALSSAAGPMPSTPGHRISEQAAEAQAQAIALLGRSERAGCAAGAAIALLIEWSAIREALRPVGQRLGVELAATLMPDRDAVASALETAPIGVSEQRALRFGAEQLCLAHRGLADLLICRAAARVDF